MLGLGKSSVFASTVWNGPPTTYVQPGTDASDPANWDQLTPNVALTRNGSMGLFNAIQETSYSHFSSPADTEWALGTLDQYASLSYTSWEQCYGSRGVLQGTITSQPAVMHLITDDIYVSVQFTQWGSFSPFAYNRSTPAVSSPPPTVSITSPASNAVFSAPAKVAIAADASVSPGSVSNVSFFDGDTLIGSVAASPFTVTATNLGAGNYSLTAVASAGGISTTSSAVNITVVTPVAITSSSPKITNGQFSFSYSANPGLSYVVQTSSNLATWLGISTNVASGNLVHFTDTYRSNANRFFRVGRLPNP